MVGKHSEIVTGKYHTVLYLPISVKSNILRYSEKNKTLI